jgi:hypothetical protein
MNNYLYARRPAPSLTQNSRILTPHLNYINNNNVVYYCLCQRKHVKH